MPSPHKHMGVRSSADSGIGGVRSSADSGIGGVRSSADSGIKSAWAEIPRRGSSPSRGELGGARGEWASPGHDGTTAARPTTARMRTSSGGLGGGGSSAASSLLSSVGSISELIGTAQAMASSSRNAPTQKRPLVGSGASPIKGMGASPAKGGKTASSNEDTFALSPGSTPSKRGGGRGVVPVPVRDVVEYVTRGQGVGVGRGMDKSPGGGSKKTALGPPRRVPSPAAKKLAAATSEDKGIRHVMGPASDSSSDDSLAGAGGGERGVRGGAVSGLPLKLRGAAAETSKKYEMLPEVVLLREAQRKRQVTSDR
jgi:hypothetical protein